MEVKQEKRGNMTKSKKETITAGVHTHTQSELPGAKFFFLFTPTFACDISQSDGCHNNHHTNYNMGDHSAFTTLTFDMKAARSATAERFPFIVPRKITSGGPEVVTGCASDSPSFISFQSKS